MGSTFCKMWLRSSLVINALPLSSIMGKSSRGDILVMVVIPPRCSTFCKTWLKSSLAITALPVSFIMGKSSRWETLFLLHSSNKDYGGDSSRVQHLLQDIQSVQYDRRENIS